MTERLNTPPSTQQPKLSLMEGAALLARRGTAPATPQGQPGAPETAPQAAAAVQSEAQHAADTDDTRDELQAGEAEAEQHDLGDETNSPLFVGEDGAPVTRAQIEEWRKGALRQADYTRKSQELAEQRRTLGEHEKVLVQGRDIIANTLQGFEHYVNAQREYLAAHVPPEPDPTLASTDPGQFIALERMRQRGLAALQDHDARVAALRQQAQQATQQGASIDESALRARAQEEEPRLLDKLPRWRDPAVRQKEVGEIQAHLGRIGLTPEVLQGMKSLQDLFMDHRFVVILRQAVVGSSVIEGGRKGGQAPSLTTAEARAPAGVKPATVRAVEQARSQLASARPGREREQAGVALLQRLRRS